MKSKGSSGFKRLVSAAVSVAFFFSLLTPSPIPAAFAQAEVFPASFIPLGVPPELASIEEAFIPPQANLEKGGARPLIHIQSVHAHPETQRKIHALLKFLDEKYGIDSMFIEGAGEKLNPEYFRFFDDNHLNVRVAEKLLEKGELTGAELFLIESQKEIPAYGIESPRLYRENLASFQKVMRQRPLTTAFSKNLRTTTDRLETLVLKKEARKLLSFRESFDAGQMQFISYAYELERAAQAVLGADLRYYESQLEWPQMIRLLRLQELESKLDLEKIQSEKESLLASMKQMGLPPDLVESFKNLSFSPYQSGMVFDPGFRKNDLPRYLAERLVEATMEKGFSFEQYPYFSRYLEASIIQSELDPSRLFEEMERLFDRLTEAMAAGRQDDLKLIGLVHKERLYERLFDLELTPKDYAKVEAESQIERPLIRFLLDLETLHEKTPLGKKKLVPQNAGEIESVFSEAIRFYQLAKEREAVMVDKILSEKGDSPQKRGQSPFSGVTLLITGGFHTEGLSRQFRQRSIPYTILTPRITEKVSSDDYIASLLGEKKTIFDTAQLEKIIKFMSAEMVAEQSPLGRAEVRQEVKIVLEALTHPDIDADPMTVIRGFNRTYGPDRRAELRISPSGENAVPFFEEKPLLTRGKNILGLKIGEVRRVEVRQRRQLLPVAVPADLISKTFSTAELPDLDKLKPIQTKIVGPEELRSAVTELSFGVTLLETSSPPARDNPTTQPVEPREVPDKVMAAVKAWDMPDKAQVLVELFETPERKILRVTEQGEWGEREPIPQILMPARRRLTPPGQSNLRLLPRSEKQTAAPPFLPTTVGARAEERVEKNEILDLLKQATDVLNPEFSKANQTLRNLAENPDSREELIKIRDELERDGVSNHLIFELSSAVSYALSGKPPRGGTPWEKLPESIRKAAREAHSKSLDLFAASSYQPDERAWVILESLSRSTPPLLYRRKLSSSEIHALLNMSSPSYTVMEANILSLANFSPDQPEIRQVLIRFNNVRARISGSSYDGWIASLLTLATFAPGAPDIDQVMTRYHKIGLRMAVVGRNSIVPALLTLGTFAPSKPSVNEMFIRFHQMGNLTAGDNHDLVADAILALVSLSPDNPRMEDIAGLHLTRDFGGAILTLVTFILAHRAKKQAAGRSEVRADSKLERLAKVDLLATQEVLSHFDIGKSEKTYPATLGLGEHGKSLIVETDHGKYVLKPISDALYPDLFEGARYEVSVVKELTRQGIPVAPLIPKKEQAAKFDDDQFFVKASNGKIYLLYQFVEGEEVNPYEMSQPQLDGLAVALAKMHNALKDFEPQGKRKRASIVDFAKQKQRTEELRSVLLGKKTSNSDYVYTSAEKFFLDHVDFILDQLNLLELDLPPPLYQSLPRTQIHGDFHPGNVRFRGDEVISIFDWDHLREEIRSYDFFNGLFPLSTEQKYFNVDGLIRAVRLYQEVAPLTDDEIKVLPEIARLKFLDMLTWWVRVEKLAERHQHDLSHVPPLEQAIAILDLEPGVLGWFKENMRVLEDIDRRIRDKSFGQALDRIPRSEARASEERLRRQTINRVFLTGVAGVVLSLGAVRSLSAQEAAPADSSQESTPSPAAEGKDGKVMTLIGPDGGVWTVNTGEGNLWLIKKETGILRKQFGGFHLHWRSDTSPQGWIGGPITPAIPVGKGEEITISFRVSNRKDAEFLIEVKEGKTNLTGKKVPVVFPANPDWHTVSAPVKARQGRTFDFFAISDLRGDDLLIHSIRVIRRPSSAPILSESVNKTILKIEGLTEKVEQSRKNAGIALLYMGRLSEHLARDARKEIQSLAEEKPALTEAEMTALHNALRDLTEVNGIEFEGNELQKLANDLPKLFPRSEMRGERTEIALPFGMTSIFLAAAGVFVSATSSSKAEPVSQESPAPQKMDQEKIKKLMEQLKNGTMQDQVLAAMELGERGVADALPLMFQRLKESRAQYPESFMTLAIMHLAERGVKVPEEVRLFLEEAVSTGNDENVVTSAIRALGTIGDSRSIPVLEKPAMGDKVYPAWNAVQALGNIAKKTGNPEALSILIKIAEDGNHAVIRGNKEGAGRVRTNAITSLMEIGNAQALSTLKKLLNDPDVEIQKQAGFAIVAIEINQFEQALGNPKAMTEFIFKFITERGFRVKDTPEARQWVEQRGRSWSRGKQDRVRDEFGNFERAFSPDELDFLVGEGILEKQAPSPRSEMRAEARSVNWETVKRIGDSGEPKQVGRLIKLLVGTAQYWNTTYMTDPDLRKHHEKGAAEIITPRGDAHLRGEDGEILAGFLTTFNEVVTGEGTGFYVRLHLSVDRERLLQFLSFAASQDPSFDEARQRPYLDLIDEIAPAPKPVITRSVAQPTGPTEAEKEAALQAKIEAAIKARVAFIVKSHFRKAQMEGTSPPAIKVYRNDLNSNPTARDRPETFTETGAEQLVQQIIQGQIGLRSGEFFRISWNGQLQDRIVRASLEMLNRLAKENKFPILVSIGKPVVHLYTEDGDLILDASFTVPITRRLIEIGLVYWNRDVEQFRTSEAYPLQLLNKALSRSEARVGVIDVQDWIDGQLRENKLEDVESDVRNRPFPMIEYLVRRLNVQNSLLARRAAQVLVQTRLHIDKPNRERIENLLESDQAKKHPWFHELIADTLLGIDAKLSAGRFRIKQEILLLDRMVQKTLLSQTRGWQITLLTRHNRAVRELERLGIRVHPEVQLKNFGETLDALQKNSTPLLDLVAQSLTPRVPLMEVLMFLTTSPEGRHLEKAFTSKTRVRLTIGLWQPGVEPTVGYQPASTPDARGSLLTVYLSPTTDYKRLFEALDENLSVPANVRQAFKNLIEQAKQAKARLSSSRAEVRAVDFTSPAEQIKQELLLRLSSVGPQGFIEYLNSQVTNQQVEIHLWSQAGSREPFIHASVNPILLHIHEKVEILAMQLGLPQHVAHEIAMSVVEEFLAAQGPWARLAKPLPFTLELVGTDERLPMILRRKDDGTVEIKVQVLNENQKPEWIEFEKLFSYRRNLVPIYAVDHFEAKNVGHFKALKSMVSNIDPFGNLTEIRQILESFREYATDSVRSYPELLKAEELQRVEDEERRLRHASQTPKTFHRSEVRSVHLDAANLRVVGEQDFQANQGNYNVLSLGRAAAIAQSLKLGLAGDVEALLFLWQPNEGAEQPVFLEIFGGPSREQRGHVFYADPRLFQSDMEKLRAMRMEAHNEVALSRQKEAAQTRGQSFSGSSVSFEIAGWLSHFVRHGSNVDLRLEIEPPDQEKDREINWDGVTAENVKVTRVARYDSSLKPFEREQGMNRFRTLYLDEAGELSEALGLNLGEDVEAALVFWEDHENGKSLPLFLELFGKQRERRQGHIFWIPNPDWLKKRGTLFFDEEAFQKVAALIKEENGGMAPATLWRTDFNLSQGRAEAEQADQTVFWSVEPRGGYLANVTPVGVSSLEEIRQGSEINLEIAYPRRSEVRSATEVAAGAPMNQVTAKGTKSEGDLTLDVPNEIIIERRDGGKMRLALMGTPSIHGLFGELKIHASYHLYREGASKGEWESKPIGSVNITYTQLGGQYSPFMFEIKGKVGGAAEDVAVSLEREELKTGEERQIKNAIKSYFFKAGPGSLVYNLNPHLEEQTVLQPSPTTGARAETRALNQLSQAAIDRFGTVLVADDEPAIRDTLGVLFPAIGLTKFETAENGARALEIFKANSEKFGLIITDLQMPQMGGEELARRANEVKAVPVLFTTGQNVQTVSVGGAIRSLLLKKPFKLQGPQGLVETLEALAQQAPAAVEEVTIGGTPESVLGNSKTEYEAAYQKLSQSLTPAQKAVRDEMTHERALQIYNQTLRGYREGEYVKLHPELIGNQAFFFKNIDYYELLNNKILPLLAGGTENAEIVFAFQFLKEELGGSRSEFRRLAPVGGELPAGLLTPKEALKNLRAETRFEAGPVRFEAGRIPAPVSAMPVPSGAGAMAPAPLLLQRFGGEFDFDPRIAVRTIRELFEVPLVDVRLSREAAEALLAIIAESLDQTLGSKRERYLNLLEKEIFSKDARFGGMLHKGANAPGAHVILLDHVPTSQEAAGLVLPLFFSKNAFLKIVLTPEAVADAGEKAEYLARVEKLVEKLKEVFPDGRAEVLNPGVDFDKTVLNLHEALYRQVLEQSEGAALPVSVEQFAKNNLVFSYPETLKSRLEPLVERLVKVKPAEIRYRIDRAGRDHAALLAGESLLAVKLAQELLSASQKGALVPQGFNRWGADEGSLGEFARSLQAAIEGHERIFGSA